MMVGYYTLLVKSGCPYCVKAIELLQEKELPFRVINYVPMDDGRGENLLSAMKSMFGHSTVPIVIREEEDKNFKLVGGYTDLVEHLDGE